MRVVYFATKGVHFVHWLYIYIFTNIQPFERCLFNIFTPSEKYFAEIPRTHKASLLCGTHPSSGIIPTHKSIARRALLSSAFEPPPPPWRLFAGLFTNNVNNSGNSLFSGIMILGARAHLQFFSICDGHVYSICARRALVCSKIKMK